MTQIGMVLNIAAEEGRSDGQVVREHLALGDLVEPLGFDSLFVLEHHFSGYVMSPVPFAALSYFAGRTRRIKLGTAVVVLPWHDPIRVAEEVAFLDIISEGRCLFAFGRGRSQYEYEVLRVPMSESRERFAESTQIVIGSLSNEVFRYEGSFYNIPPCSIRPRPISKPQERFYGAASGKESAGSIAKLGLGLMLSTQKSWSSLASDVNYFNNVAVRSGYQPKGPIILSSIYVARTTEEARERATIYFGREWDMIDTHYHYSDETLGSIPGYESYVETQQYFTRLADQSFRDQATRENIGLQIVGSPDDCIRQIDKLVSLTGAEHLILEFSFGGMSCREAAESMRLFSSDVMPFLSIPGRAK